MAGGRLEEFAMDGAGARPDEDVVAGLCGFEPSKLLAEAEAGDQGLVDTHLEAGQQ